ncbi:MAG: IclR family transcriptional regulator [Acetobacteraceae bacterium]
MDPVDPPHKNHDAYSVPGLQRGLRVLEMIAAARRPMTVSEVSEQLTLTRSSTFRLLYTLRDMGFLEAVPNSKAFRLGARVLNIGFAYLASMDIIELARPELERLRDRTNVTAHLAIRDGQELLYLSCVQTRSGFLSTFNVGARLPAYAVPMGWLLLAGMAQTEVATLLNDVGFDALTRHTPRNLSALMARIAQAAATGYVVSRGIVEPGGSSLSAAVFDQGGRTVAAIDIAGPDSAFDCTDLTTRYLAEVMDAAARISARLGHRPTIPHPAPAPSIDTEDGRS